LVGAAGWWWVYKSIKTKKKKRQEKFDIDGGNNDVENRAWILYNDTVDQLKGM